MPRGAMRPPAPCLADGRGFPQSGGPGGCLGLRGQRHDGECRCFAFCARCCASCWSGSSAASGRHGASDKRAPWAMRQTTAAVAEAACVCRGLPCLQMSGAAGGFAALDNVHRTTAVLGDAIGAVTLTGSAIAYGKLVSCGKRGARTAPRIPLHTTVLTHLCVHQLRHCHRSKACCPLSPSACPVRTPSTSRCWQQPPWRRARS